MANRTTGEGYVYVLVNPSMQGKVKIGQSDNVERRLKQLSRHAGVPEPFKLFYKRFFENQQIVFPKISQAT